MKGELDPYYAEYLFTNKTRILDLAKASYDCVEDDSALLQVASIESPVKSYNVSFVFCELEELKKKWLKWMTKANSLVLQ